MDNKINFIKLIKNPNGYGYVQKESSQHWPLINLYMFLEDDVWKDIEEWKDKIKKSDCISGNISLLFFNDEKVFVGTLIEENLKEKDFFQTTKKEMIEILDTWGKLLEKVPKEIILFQDKDGKTWLEGQDEETPSIYKHDKKKSLLYKIKNLFLPI